LHIKERKVKKSFKNKFQKKVFYQLLHISKSSAIMSQKLWTTFVLFSFFKTKNKVSFSWQNITLLSRLVTFHIWPKTKFLKTFQEIERLNWQLSKIFVPLSHAFLGCGMVRPYCAKILWICQFHLHFTSSYFCSTKVFSASFLYVPFVFVFLATENHQKILVKMIMNGIRNFSDIK